MTTFNIGDKVLCIEPNEAPAPGSLAPQLVKDQEYTITKVETSLDATFIYLDNINFGWNPKRFKKAEKADKCICSTRDLMFRGCKCGQMERERDDV